MSAPTGSYVATDALDQGGCLPDAGPADGGARPRAPLVFDHLRRLSDDTGLLEHARGAIPRREHGYCLDDVARGLLVVGRQPALAEDSTLVDLAARYLAFVAHAQDATGRCHNRLGYDRLWHDEAGVDDCWGRALWALGSCAAGDGPAWLRAEALDRFELSASLRSPWVRASAFAALGAAAVLGTWPAHVGARELASDMLGVIGRPGTDPSWPWPEPRLTYANATITEALIAAGRATGDPSATRDGLRLLRWLFEVQTAGRRLSLTPANGWARGEARPAFDQQPIEAAALAEAAGRAFEVTADPIWLADVDLCVGWFSGANDSSIPLWDPVTGAGFDGLEPAGRNANQGAESTLAALATFQVADRLAARC